MAIKITFLNDIVNFLKGTKDMGAALEDVEDSLTDVADEAERAGDESGKALSDGVSDGARDGQRALDRLEREFTDTSKTAKREMDDTAREARRSGDKIADDLGGGFEKAGDAAGDMAGDVGDAIGDVITEASKGGEDIGGALIDGISTLASAAIPGIGAGIGGVIGGIASGAYEAWRESAERTEQRTSEMYADMIASGENYLSQKYIQAEIERLVDEDSAGLEEKASRIGVGVQEMAAALAGNGQILADVLDTARQKHEDLQQSIDAATSYEEKNPLILDRADVDEVIQALEDVGSSYETATGKAQLAADAVRLSVENTPPLQLELDAGTAQADLQAFVDEADAAGGTVTIDAETEEALSRINAVVQKSYTATVKVVADMSEAEAAVFAFLTKPRPAIQLQAEVVPPRGVPVP